MSRCRVCSGEGSYMEEIDEEKARVRVSCWVCKGSGKAPEFPTVAQVARGLLPPGKVDEGSFKKAHEAQAGTIACYKCVRCDDDGVIVGSEVITAQGPMCEYCAKETGHTPIVIAYVKITIPAED